MKTLLLCLASFSAAAQVTPPLIGHICTEGRHWLAVGVPGNLLLQSGEEPADDCASLGAQLLTRTGVELRIDGRYPLTLPDESWLLLAGPAGLGAVRRDGTQLHVWQANTGWQQFTLPELAGVIAAALPRSGELLLMRDDNGGRVLTRYDLTDGRQDDQPVAAGTQLLSDGSLLVPQNDQWARQTATGLQPLDWTGPITALRPLNATWTAVAGPDGRLHTLLFLSPHATERHDLPAPAEVQQ